MMLNVQKLIWVSGREIIINRSHRYIQQTLSQYFSRTSALSYSSAHVGSQTCCLCATPDTLRRLLNSRSHDRGRLLQFSFSKRENTNFGGTLHDRRIAIGEEHESSDMTSKQTRHRKPKRRNNANLRKHEKEHRKDASYFEQKLHNRPTTSSELHGETEDVFENQSAVDIFGTWADSEDSDNIHSSKRISKLQKPISELQKPKSELQKQISELQKPISELQKPMSELQRRKSNREWTETFGGMASDLEDDKDFDSKRSADDEDEDEFEEPYKRLSSTGRANSPVWYGRQIEKLAKQGKIYECIEMLEVKMLKEDRVKPDRYVFTVLIGALGRVGYTKKAFKVYNMMKRMGLQPEDPTYTGLFNACANSPYPENGLQSAKHLRDIMKEKYHQPNKTTYKAMIKAFGRCGDLQTAFSLVDEMTSASIGIDDEVLSMLLQACISEKEAGLRFAIEVWRRINRLKMKQKITPSIFHYNLLIRAIKECGIGDPLLANQLLREPANQGLLEEMTAPSGELKNRDSGGDTVSTGEQLMKSEESLNESSRSWWSYNQNSLATIPETPGDTSLNSISILDADIPDILSYKGDFAQVVGLTNLHSAQDRLALFGGFPKILMNMQRDNVRPDIRTFTQLIDLIPPNADSELDLMVMMNLNEVKPDVDFFNLLIRKRSLRHDYIGAREILKFIADKKLVPNNMTYGCLAMGCSTKRDGLCLLNDMQDDGLNISVEICNALLYQSNMNFSYKIEILKVMREMGTKPNERTLKRLEQQIRKGQDIIVAMEKGEQVKPRVSSREYGDFRKYYNKWLMTMGLENELKGPWEQFKKPTPAH